MTQVNRLNGGLIDRGTPLAFTFDGKRYGGFAGDTLASALVANGVRLVGRSFSHPVDILPSLWLSHPRPCQIFAHFTKNIS